MGGRVSKIAELGAAIKQAANSMASVSREQAQQQGEQSRATGRVVANSMPAIKTAPL